MPPTSIESPGRTAVTSPERFAAMSAGATSLVPSFRSCSISSGWKWSSCACVMKMTSAGSEVSTSHGSMKTVSPSPCHL